MSTLPEADSFNTVTETIVDVGSTAFETWLAINVSGSGSLADRRAISITPLSSTLYYSFSTTLSPYDAGVFQSLSVNQTLFITAGEAAILYVWQNYDSTFYVQVTEYA